MKPDFYVFECSGCRIEHRTPKPIFPAGWSACQGHAFCPPCQTAEIVNGVIEEQGRRLPGQRAA